MNPYLIDLLKGIAILITFAVAWFFVEWLIEKHKEK